jgi:3-oxoacyl-[acyl-carrier-protein] synthase II
MFVLEDLEGARARGARIHAELVGYAATMNAYRMTDPPPDGGGVTLAMARALEESGVPREDIGYIAAHGTSTPGNDLCETLAIKDVFGAHAPHIAISSVKSMVGHLTAAAAGVGLIGALGVLREGRAPPTINLESPGPKLDLDYVPNTAKSVDTSAAMVNAFAFGGTNACFIVQKVGAS